MPEFNEDFHPGPLPEDKDIPQEQIDSIPQVAAADRIISRIDAQHAAADAAKEERERLRCERDTFSAIPLTEVPKYVADSVTVTERLVHTLEERFDQDPDNEMLGNQLEQARVYLREISSVNTILSQHSDSVSANDLRILGQKVFNRRKHLEELLSPAERWPGQKIHQASAAESAPGAYDRSIAETENKEGATADFIEHIQPDEYLAEINVGVNLLHQRQAEATELTEAVSKILNRAEDIRTKAQALYFGLRHFQNIPTISSERRELEAEHVKHQLHDLLWELDRLNEDFSK